MTGFDLPNNFNPNPERIGRIVRHHVVLPQKRVTWPSGSPSTSASSPMAQKTLRQFSAPSSSHIPTGLNQDQAGNDGFEMKTEQHHQPQGYYVGYRPPSAIPVLTAREGQDVVLLQQGGFHNMGSLFKCIPGKILPGGQDQL